MFLIIQSCSDEGDQNIDKTPIKPHVSNSDPVTTKARFQIEDRSSWKIIYVSSDMASQKEHAKNAIDNDPKTIWHTQWAPKTLKHPHELHIDMGKEHNVHGFTYLPRQSGINGTIQKYEFYVSNDPKNWGEAVAAGEFENIKFDQGLTVTSFDKIAKGRYFRFVALSEINKKAWASAAEISVIIEE